MTQQPLQISKSQYLKGKQCSLNLWYALYRKAMKPEIDPVREAIFNAGREVGDWAKKRFPDGAEVTAPYFKTAEGAAETKALISAGHKAIFEATAVHPADGTHARIDVLNKGHGADTWDMIEVKGSTGVDDYHLDDLSFQYRVFTAAGYRISKCFIMHINNKYVRRGAIDSQALFTLEDITAQVLAKQPEVDAIVARLLTLNPSREPQVRIGGHCAKPFKCDYEYHCWRHVPEYSIYNVLTSKKADELVENLGSYEIKSMPAEAIPAGAKKIDVSSHVTGEAHIDPGKLRGFLEGLQYPLYYLDYETISSAIPLFDGTRPFQQIPFQFSLHVEESQGAELRSYGFLHKERTDPRPAFVQDLLKYCGDRGTVIVYNQQFEEGVNEALAEHFPEFRDAIMAINARMVDLLIPFRKRWLYHPSQNGSASIKSVLPAFTELSYDGLAIGNGQDASQQYLDFVKDRLTLDAAEKLWRDLSEYCGLDTLAMKILVDVLQEKIS